MTDTATAGAPAQRVTTPAAATPTTYAVLTPNPTAPENIQGTLNRSSFDQLSSFLASYGLGSLFSIDANGRPSGWLWDQIVNGVDTQAALQVALEQTPIFQQRYGVILRMRDAAAKGQPVVVPSIAQVREYETNAAAMLRQAGLPAWFYDSYEDAQKLMESNISLSELEQRVGESWDRVQSSPPEVKQAFEQFYGASGEAALASFFLDPDTTINQLERASRAAYAGGTARTLGIGLDRALSERIAALPLSDEAIRSDLVQVSDLQGRGVFTEGITETSDLTAEGTGVQAAVFGSGTEASQIERRILARRANAGTSSGGAALTQQGLAVGSA